MSAENGKICCNCIQERDEETLYTRCHCEVDRNFLPYTTMMDWWFRHWEKMIK